jgi:hypothetical protein
MLESEVEHLTHLLNKKDDINKFDRKIRETKLYNNLLEKIHQRCKDINRLRQELKNVIHLNQMNNKNNSEVEG